MYNDDGTTLEVRFSIAVCCLCWGGRLRVVSNSSFPDRQPHFLFACTLACTIRPSRCCHFLALRSPVRCLHVLCHRISPCSCKPSQLLTQVRTGCCNFLGFRSSVIRSVNVTTSYSATLVNGTVVSNITTAQSNITFYNGQMVVKFGRTDLPVGAAVLLLCCRVLLPLCRFAAQLLAGLPVVLLGAAVLLRRCWVGHLLHGLAGRLDECLCSSE